MLLRHFDLDRANGILHIEALVDDTVCDGSIPWDSDELPAADEIDDVLTAVADWTVSAFHYSEF